MKKLMQNKLDNSLDNENLTNNELGDTGKALKYEKPVLICYGDVRDITLGGTGGLGESGCECLLMNLPSGASGPCPVVCP